jgi:hypothetical protein
MAAPLTTVATTLEQQVLETLMRARVVITAYAAANPTADLKGLGISPQVDIVNSQATFTVILPLTYTGDTDGGFSFDAVTVV